MSDSREEIKDEIKAEIKNESKETKNESKPLDSGELKDSKIQGLESKKRKRESESESEHGQEEQEQEQEEEDEEKEQVKEPARKKQKRDKSDPGKEARRAKRREIAESDEIYQIDDTDFKSKDREKIKKGASYEQIIVEKKEELKGIKATAGVFKREVEPAFAKIIGKKKLEKIVKAAIELGNTLAANEDAKIDAQNKGKKGAAKEDKVYGAALKAMKDNCIGGKYIASNGFEYIMRAKPGKLPPANLKFVLEHQPKLMFEKKFPTGNVKSVEFLIKTVYSQTFRAKYRKAPELVFDCKLPKKPKAKAAGKSKGKGKGKGKGRGKKAQEEDEIQEEEIQDDEVQEGEDEEQGEEEQEVSDPDSNPSSPKSKPKELDIADKHPASM